MRKDKRGRMPPPRARPRARKRASAQAREGRWVCGWPAARKNQSLRAFGPQKNENQSPRALGLQKQMHFALAGNLPSDCRPEAGVICEVKREDTPGRHMDVSP